MSILKSKKFRVSLSIFAALILFVGVFGFAFTRGYFMHFLIDDQTVSRDDFLRLADEAAAGKPIHIGCAQGDWTLGWLYIYESHCFTSDSALNIYMQQHFGSAGSSS